jgi:hypothetical protein
MDEHSTAGPQRCPVDTEGREVFPWSVGRCGAVVLMHCLRCVQRRAPTAMPRMLAEAAARGIHPSRVMFLDLIDRGSNMKRSVF